MGNRITTVPKLSVKIVTEDTGHPGENGFSTIFAEVTPEDSSLLRQLAQAQEHPFVVAAALRNAGRDRTNHESQDRGRNRSLRALR